MHTVPQNKDKFTINNLFYCCKALIFTHPSVYEFLCGLIFMGHPVLELLGNASLNPFPTLLLTTVGVAENTHNNSGKRFPHCWRVFSTLLQ